MSSSSSSSSSRNGNKKAIILLFVAYGCKGQSPISWSIVEFENMVQGRIFGRKRVEVT
jgi:hypothetical protein